MSVWPPPSTAPAGWYHDPSGELRYFDGRGWEPLSQWRSAPGIDSAASGRGRPTKLPLRAAMIGVAVIVASLISARMIVGLLLAANLPFLLYVLVLATLGYGPALIYSLWAVRRWGSGSVVGDLGLRPRPSDLGWGVLLWFVAVCAQLLITVALLVLDVPSGSNVEGIEELSADRTYVAVVLVTAVIAAPVVEELLFRGVILPGFLSAMPAVAAIVLQGVLFGAIHIDPDLGSGNVGLAIVLSVVGVVLGAGTYLLRRLVPAIVAHGVFNGVVLVLVFSGVLDQLDAATR